MSDLRHIHEPVLSSLKMKGIRFFFLDQRNQTETQWLQDLYQSNIDNINNVRCEDSRHFRNKNKKYLKAKIEELETNSKIKVLGTCIVASVNLRRITSLN
jgi:hypothetical protein